MQTFGYTPLYHYKREVTHINGKREYTDHLDDVYYSNTTVLSEYENTYIIDKWIENVGVEAANKISFESSQAGTNAHFAVEHYLEHKDRIENIYANVAIDNFYGHLDLSRVGIEEPVFYNYQGLKVAGRYDQLVQIPANTFKFKKSGEFVPACFAISDLKTKRSYKNDKKLKPLPTANAIQNTFKNCLQESMYSATICLQTDFKKLYGKGVEAGVIVYVNEKKSRLLYLNLADLNYYWRFFKILLRDYHNIAPLSLSWAEMIDAAKCRWDEDLGLYVNNLPKEIILNV